MHDQEWFQRFMERIDKFGEDFVYRNLLSMVQAEVRLVRPCDIDRLMIEDPKPWPHLKGWLMRQNDLPERTRQYICDHRSVTVEPDGSVTCNRCNKNAEVGW